MSEIDLKHFILSVLMKHQIKTKLLQRYFRDKNCAFHSFFWKAVWLLPTFLEKFKSQRSNTTEIAYIHLFKHLCNNSKTTFLQVIISACFELNFVKMYQDIHWNSRMAITLANGIKEKRLFLLHIEVDSHNPTDNTVQYMISVPLLVPFLCGSLE